MTTPFSAPKTAVSCTEVDEASISFAAAAGFSTAALTLPSNGSVRVNRLEPGDEVPYVGYSGRHIHR